jgi:hypothetical protein
MRLLVVATYRDTDIGRTDPLTDLLGDLRRLDGAERLPLAGLDGPDVATFIEKAAGHGLDDDGEALAATVWRGTEGNPFFGGEEALRLELLVKTGEAQRRAGDAALRETLLAAGRLAQQLGDARTAARAALANGRGFWGAIGRVDEERVGALEAALGALGSSEPATRARILVNLAGELVYGPDPGRYRRLADEALTLVRQTEDVSTLAHVLMSRGFALLGADTVGERLAETKELLLLAEQLGDPVIGCLANFARVMAVLEAGDGDEAERCLVAGEALGEELGQPVLRWLLLLERVPVAGTISGGRALGEAGSRAGSGCQPA